jgi:alkylation response protein AidB-like acyl-CoA dehydrogenase
MSTTTQTERESQSFAEAALRLGGKTEEEARRTGAVDKADDQVEALFAARHQTANSPVHKAVWEKRVPLELFVPPAMPASAPCDAAMERSLAVVRRRKEAGTMYDENGKIQNLVLEELSPAGYWGMLIEPEFGGQGAPFRRFSRFLARMSTLDSMVSGLASVHGCIGAVDPVRTFGTPEQKKRLLPKLASGEVISGFALTEPCAGSDLTALRTTAVESGNDLEITGEKLFITNALPGRMVGIVLLFKGKPAVVIAQLPKEENEQFQLVRYGLYALRHGYNNGMKFNRLRVPRENLLTPKSGDGLTIAYHGLNLGRLALCAGASGSMRILLANMLPWAGFRRTYGQLINTRELVKRRIGRLAGLIAGCDAILDWGSWLIEQGYRGELECIVTKIFASESLKEAAIELFMKTHGGRSFLKGHMFGDNIYDYLAPCIYEGEGEMLGMAFFKSMVKEHGKQFFEPIGRALQQNQIRSFNPMNPGHAWALRRELTAYAKWSLAHKLSGRERQQAPVTDRRLASHVDFAVDRFGRYAAEISKTMSKHQLKLADRQCRMSELSLRVQDTVVLLVTALWGNQQKSEAAVAAADILCQDIERKLTGARPSDSYFRDVGRLADIIISGGFEALAGIPQEEILMRYETK